MIEMMKTIIPYISGLWTMPWILVGFLVSWALQWFFAQERIDFVMKKIGLIILYGFVPPLVFRIFLDTRLTMSIAIFFGLTCLVIIFMYILAYFYARLHIRRQKIEPETGKLYLKTLLTNQGRSSAFVGGALLAIPGWGVPAAIFMALMGVALFAVIPYILYHMNMREQKNKINPIKLPWFLRLYPCYFTSFVAASVVLQRTTGLMTDDFGNWGIALRFYTALTIPISLYYVGSGMHPRDLKLSELKKLTGLTQDDRAEHWQWVRQIFYLTALITPGIIFACLGLLYVLKIIPGAWMAVAVINAALPITGTNMFLVPYGIDKRATAHAVTWSTLIGVPVTVILISLFSAGF